MTTTPIRPTDLTKLEPSVVYGGFEHIHEAMACYDALCKIGTVATKYSVEDDAVWFTDKPEFTLVAEGYIFRADPIEYEMRGRFTDIIFEEPEDGAEVWLAGVYEGNPQRLHYARGDLLHRLCFTARLLHSTQSGAQARIDSIRNPQRVEG